MEILGPIKRFFGYKDKDTVITQPELEYNKEGSQLEDNQDILEKYKDFRLRLTDDDKSSHYVFDNQLKSALKAIETFKNGKRWCLLMAQMQSGKSGTYFSIPYIISRNEQIRKDLDIDIFDNEINVFLLTGMSDRDLVGQFESDIESFTGMEIKRNVLHNNEMKKFIDKDESEWSDLDKDLIDKMRRNSIILIDESHYGNEIDKILNTFLENVVGVRASSRFDLLKNNNVYVVSISATPMAERVSIADEVVGKNKEIISLETTCEYVGIEYFMENGNIHQAKNLYKEDEVNNLIQVINSLNEDGYILVRASPNDKKDKVIEKLPDDVYYFSYNQVEKETMANNTDIDDILDNKPNGKQIIFLNRMLGAGKRINTENILMVHDTADSKADTTAQSLLGRCCGYNKNKDVLIYCDETQAQAYYDWVINDFPLGKTPPKVDDLNSPRSNDIEGLKTVNPIVHIIHDERIYDDIINRKSKHEVRNRILDSLNDERINYYRENYNIIHSPTFYVVSEDDDQRESTYKKHYLDKLNGGFAHDLPKRRKLNENIGDIVASLTFNKDTKELIVSLGKIVEPDGIPKKKENVM